MDPNYHDSKDEACCESGNDDSESQIGLVSSRFKAVKSETRRFSGTSIAIAAQSIIILVLGFSLVILLGKLPSYLSLLPSSCPPSIRLDIDVGIISPAREAVRFHEKTLYAHVQRNGGSTFQGRPTTEINTAWADLTRPSYIRVTKQELDAANATSMQTPTGDHFVTLNAYHHLHCLRAIKRYIYAQYYHPNVPVEEIRTDSYSDHIDHCVDLLRETIMCQPDFSMATFQWEGDAIKHPVQNGKTSHQCVDWNYFETWSKERALDVQEVLDYWALVSGKEFTDS